METQRSNARVEVRYQQLLTNQPYVKLYDVASQRADVKVQQLYPTTQSEEPDTLVDVCDALAQDNQANVDLVEEVDTLVGVCDEVSEREAYEAAQTEGRSSYELRRGLTLTDPKVNSKVEHTRKPLEEGSSAAVLSVCDGGAISLTWESGLHLRFHSSWLRHNCHCAVCRQEGSGQKSLDPAQFPERLTISEVELKGVNIELRWREESDHVGSLPLKFLRDNSYDESMLRHKQVTRRPREYLDKGLPRVHFDDVKTSSDGLFSLMSMVQEFGLCLVEGMQTAREGATELAEKIAPVQHTIYGKKFDVVSSPDPINIAYSCVHLDLHMDLAYYESPPGLQIFNCARFDDCVVGGESIFLDVFPLMEDFRSRYPWEFENLARIPATFQKIHFNRDRPVYMTYQRPHVALNADKEIIAVFWSPAFEGPLSVPEKDVEPYYRAYHLLSKVIRASPLRKTIRLNPGEAIVFNNRRVLHGRNEFSLNGGQRHFEGCYLNIDEFLSHFRFLSHSKGGVAIGKRLGNQCWS